jgi:lysine/ornithine N-monooxygenase
LVTRYPKIKNTDFLIEGKNMVNHTEFDAFWDWFGKSMQKLRYQRHIGSLWQNG